MTILQCKCRYQVMLGCDLCEVAWWSGVVETNLETLFEMNKRAFCPECSACSHHEDPDLRVAPVILNIKNVDNEFAIISQF
jgi:hypothetical protein